jgi:hypothetical protein
METATLAGSGEYAAAADELTPAARPTWADMMNVGQARMIKSAMRGEEGNHFREKMKEIDAVLARMPVTYQSDEQGENAVAHLHYFMGGVDAWITELDCGSPDDQPGEEQSQAFGLIDLGFGPELGYISIPELLSVGMELDLYWTPKTIAAIKASKEG